MVYPAESVYVAEGVNRGDPLGPSDMLVPDDIYALDPDMLAARLTIVTEGRARFSVAAESPTGRAGARLVLDSALLLIGDDGRDIETILLSEEGEEGSEARHYLLTPIPLRADTTYTLASIDPEGAAAAMAKVACLSFSRGTRVSLASGTQVPIEELKVGDKVLTRDSGPQAIRWIGQSTVRAVGAFAPILIRAGALHNSDDLLVSPDHRLFVYQRSDRLGAGRAELLIRARHLVNGTSVIRQGGGFVDYFQILFDRHQIIYAEGIAAESLPLDARTLPAIPDSLANLLGRELSDPRSRIRGLDPGRDLLDRPDVVELLRRASLK